MLPSYSGGLFEILQQGLNAVAEPRQPILLKRAAASMAAAGLSRSGSVRTGEPLGAWLPWRRPGLRLRLGNPDQPHQCLGVTVSYLRGAVDDFNTGPKDQQVGTAYGAGVYWRENDGALRTDASINVGAAEMNGTRNFSSADLSGGNGDPVGKFRLERRCGAGPSRCQL